MSIIATSFAALQIKQTNMKKVLSSIFMVVVIAMTILSCGNKSDPKKVAASYLNALKKMDYETAKKFGTPETGKMLDMMSSFSGMMPDSIKDKAKDVKVEIKEAKEQGDKCVVSFTSSEKPGAEESLNLVKKDGKWLVNMTKDDMGGGMGESAPAEEGGTPAPDEASPATENDTTKAAEPK